jgi:hypothetical protein
MTGEKPIGHHNPTSAKNFIPENLAKFTSIGGNFPRADTSFRSASPDRPESDIHLTALYNR